MHEIKGRRANSIQRRTLPHLVFVLTIVVWLVACAPSPIHSENATSPNAELWFVDLQGFDRDLASSLSAPLPAVKVVFYDRVVPSALPDRLQPWMAAVENSGGKVTVVPPKSSVTAKGPLLLLGALTSLWSASKMAKEISVKAQFRAANAYDAEILLKQDEKGEIVVDHVVFIHRQSKP